MTPRFRLLVVTLTLIACLAAAQPVEVSAQGHVSIGVGVGVGGPGYYHGHGYGYGYPWYPYFGFGFGYPYPYAYAYAPIYPYPYYDPFAGLKLQVTPRETEVFIDGYLAGIVDNFDGTFQRLDLSPGEHDLELFLPGHRVVHKRLLLQPGKTSRVKLAMQTLTPGEPEPVRPSAQPLPPAAIPQQGAPQQGNPSTGPAPSRRPQGPGPGPSAPPNPSPSITTAPPAPVTESDYGSLSLRVQPGAATIVVDGEKWEGANSDERLVLQLAPGRHVVEIQKDGYRRYTTEVDVKARETTSLNVSLTATTTGVK